MHLARLFRLLCVVAGWVVSFETHLQVRRTSQLLQIPWCCSWRCSKGPSQAHWLHTNWGASPILPVTSSLCSDRDRTLIAVHISASSHAPPHYLIGTISFWASIHVRWPRCTLVMDISAVREPLNSGRQAQWIKVHSPGCYSAH